MSIEERSIDNIGDQARNSGIITDIIIGISDGLTVPFALAAGLSAVGFSTNPIFVVGIVAVITGALAMGFGGYFTIKSEGHHDAHEHGKINTEDASQFYSNLGLTKETQKKATIEILKDKEQWQEVMMQYGSTEKQKSNAARSGLVIGVSYALGGLVPLLPYLLVHNPSSALSYSAFVTIIALFLFGWLKSKASGMNPLFGAARETIIGALAAGGAFLVAGLFNN